MLPRMISCEDCGESAHVRGYGRVEYSWRTPGEAEFKTIRLTIDCPRCGVKVQEHNPERKFQPVHEGQR